MGTVCIICGIELFDHRMEDEYNYLFKGIKHVLWENLGIKNYQKDVFYLPIKISIPLSIIKAKTLIKLFFIHPSKKMGYIETLIFR